MMDMNKLKYFFSTLERITQTVINYHLQSAEGKTIATITQTINFKKREYYSKKTYPTFDKELIKKITEDKQEYIASIREELLKAYSKKENHLVGQVLFKGECIKAVYSEVTITKTRNATYDEWLKYKGVKK